MNSRSPISAAKEFRQIPKDLDIESQWHFWVTHKYLVPYYYTFSFNSETKEKEYKRIFMVKKTRIITLSS